MNLLKVSCFLKSFFRDTSLDLQDESVCTSYNSSNAYGCVSIFYFLFISPPEPKAQVSFSDQNFPLSVVGIAVVVFVVDVVVNLSHVNLFLQNHWAIFNQTWHNALLGKGDSSLVN